MVADQSMLMRLMQAIVVGDQAIASRLLTASPSLGHAHLEQGATRLRPKDYYFDQIAHYAYAGDTAIHIAAAGYRSDFVRDLVVAGADVSARNRRGAQPLHYACDGAPGHAGWNPPAQAATVAFLIEAGADPDAMDASGVTPLHRAVRTRCAAAVSALLAAGADPRRTNRRGTTPMKLAVRPTGRGGSGSPQSKAQQQEIVRMLRTPPGCVADQQLDTLCHRRRLPATARWSEYAVRTA
jgi:hypothetical protein